MGNLGIFGGLLGFGMFDALQSQENVRAQLMQQQQQQYDWMTSIAAQQLSLDQQNARNEYYNALANAMASQVFAQGATVSEVPVKREPFLRRLWGWIVLAYWYVDHWPWYVEVDDDSR